MVLERMGRAIDLGEAAPVFAKLEHEIARVLPELGAFAAGPAAPGPAPASHARAGRAGEPAG